MDNYLSIGVLIGTSYFMLVLLNLLFNFTTHPLINVMIDNKKVTYLNLLSLLFLSVAICLLWPFWIIFILLYFWIYILMKKK